MRVRVILGGVTIVLAGAVGFTASRLPVTRMGRQPDGSYVVSSGQRVAPNSIAFDGRPIDMALHPTEEMVAVLNQNSVFLATSDGVMEGSESKLSGGAGFHGAIWTPDGTRLLVSVSDGFVQRFKLTGKKLESDGRIDVKPADAKENPRPGGMAITADGSRLYVAAADRNAVAEIAMPDGRFLKEYPVQNLPFDVKLSEDEKRLIVTNWGGRVPRNDDEKAESGNALIVVDPRGIPASGTVSIIDIATGDTHHVDAGLHPTSIAIQGNRAYIANAASDNIGVLDVDKRVVETAVPIQWGSMKVFGSMPCALAAKDNTLYVCNGGDNALCEIDLPSSKVKGFRAAGYYPVAIALSRNGKSAYVLNTKGNGSTGKNRSHPPHNSHDFQGTLTIVDLGRDLVNATAEVVANNGWDRDRSALKPNIPVYNGAIKHVLYIIKENRTYDEVFGDMPEGNGDPKLCGIGERIMPNHRAIARQFTLFDNGYVSGTNSADGHAWSTQSVANDYLEHFYTGYRTYPDDGDCAMSIASSGTLWDAALKAGKSVRVYGEFCDDRLAEFTPKPKDWLEMWKDREAGSKRIKVRVGTRVAGLKKLIHPEVVYWPLLQSDQRRADLFIEEYQEFSRKKQVPNLMILSLPCDHTEGLDPNYPKPQSMMADNDLALGRVVEALSKSPEWKNTCIFVIEDDAQSGPDHIDGHRTVYMAISPYTRRKFVDSSLYTTASMLRSIELMLGIPPMNRFDAVSIPLAACFTDKPDLSTYTAIPSNVRLDDMNPPKSALRGKERYWMERSMALDWSGLDKPDFQVLNQIIWHSLHGVDKPYPTLKASAKESED